MSKFLKRKEAVDLLFEGYFGTGKGAVVALLPDSWEYLSETESDPAERVTRLSSQEAKIQLLQFLADGYLEQYRHYDNQRAKLAGILVAAVAGFSIAPFTLGDSHWNSILAFGRFQSALIVLSTTALILIAFIGWISSMKHRLRMKAAYDRYKRVLKEIEHVAEDVDVQDIHAEGKKGKHILDGVTRGLIWILLPWIVIIYALTYCFLYFQFKLTAG